MSGNKRITRRSNDPRCLPVHGKATCQAALLPVILCLGAMTGWATPTPTTTTLTVSSKTINNHPITAMTATVSPTLTQGLVLFYDGKVLLGTGQIVNTGTKYVHGSAYLSAQLAPGAHSLKAVFAGRNAYATSASTAQSWAVAGGVANTTISSSGSAGNYTLTGTVTGLGGPGPTGQVQFVDQTTSSTIGSATLGSVTGSKTMATAANYPIYDTTDYQTPEQVVSGDFNGDGILDLSIQDYDTGVSIYLGKGDGTFLAAKPFCTTGTPPVPCPAGSEPTGIAVGDFNSDGIPDLVVVSGSFVSVALGKGDGTFKVPVNYDSASGANSVLVSDLNRDGWPDLVVSVDGGISVLMGNGNGTFQPHNDVSLTDASTYISIGDFNKDGIPDVISAGWNGSDIMVLLGKGDGTFQAEKDTPIDINTASCQVQAVDLKGSGYLQDVAFCGSSTLEAMTGKGDGTFNAPQEMAPSGTFSEFVAGLTAADINGDGATDLVMTWYSSDTDTGRVAVFANKNDGTGTFNASPTQYLVGKVPVSVIAGDFNGDGTMDLAVANQNDNAMSVLVDTSKQKATATLTGASVPGTGDQSVVAQYMGDTNYAGSTSTAITLQGSGGTTSVTITSISPTTAVQGSGALTLTVNGTGFATGAVVYWNGSARTTAFVSATKVTAAILATDLTTVGSFPITVKVGTVTSNSVNFAVTAATGATPTITSISPYYVYRYAAALTMTVTGTNFVSGATVNWGTTSLTTTFVSATTLTAAVPAANLTSLGTFTIKVTNPGGAASNTVPFTVGPNTHLPLAYGFVNKNGSMGAASPNLSCTWSSPEYLCTISGETFYFSSYVVNATVADIATPAVATVNSVGGQIIVKIYNLSGTAIQAPFFITVFKP